MSFLFVKCCDRQDVATQEEVAPGPAPAPVGMGMDSIPKLTTKAPEVTSGKETEFSITLEKRGDLAGAKLGIDVDHKDGKTLLIEGINAGMIDTWNLEHPEQIVKPGDRIVSVNGVSGDAMKVVGECKAANVLRMAVRRG